MAIEDENISDANSLMYNISRMVADVQKQYPQLDYFNASRMAMGVGVLPFRFDKQQPKNNDDGAISEYA